MKKTDIFLVHLLASPVANNNNMIYWNAINEAELLYFVISIPVPNVNVFWCPRFEEKCVFMRLNFVLGPGPAITRIGEKYFEEIKAASWMSCSKSDRS